MLSDQFEIAIISIHNWYHINHQRNASCWLFGSESSAPPR